MQMLKKVNNWTILFDNDVEMQYQIAKNVENIKMWKI